MLNEQSWIGDKLWTFISGIRFEAKNLWKVA